MTDWSKVKFIPVGRDCTWADSGRYLAMIMFFKAMPYPKIWEPGRKINK